MRKAPRCRPTTQPASGKYTMPRRRLQATPALRRRRDLSQQKVRLPPQVLPEFLAGIAANEQRDEGTDGGAVEACSHLAQALVDGPRIKVVVELRVDVSGHHV